MVRGINILIILKNEAWSILWVSLHFNLTVDVLKSYNTAFIRTILEYGNEIWDTYNQFKKGEIEKANQNGDTRITKGATKLIST